MAAFQEFLGEKNEIDALIAKGYIVVQVHENLDGAVIHFQAPDSKDPITSLRLTTADARKYVTTLLFANRAKA